MVSESAAEHPPRQRRRIPACLRCRHRKTKCDNKLPVCSNCERAGASCDHGGALDRIRADQLQSRVAFLENLLKTHAPYLEADPSGEQPQTVPDVPVPSNVHVRTDSSIAQPPPISTSLSPPTSHGQAHFASRHSPFTEQPVQGVPSQSAGNTAPDLSFDHNHSAGHSEATQDTDTTIASICESRIGPEQPLAHDVGLLSLGNTTSDPKYLGPSSGVSFARLIYAAAPQTQGLPASKSPGSAQGPNGSSDPVVCIPLPKAAQMHRFVDSYLEAFSQLYPFLQQSYIDELIEKKCQQSPAEQGRNDLDLALLFLVAALGARNLERLLDTDLRSNGYLASAMAEIERVQLHDSLRGVQIMLLLVLASLWFPKGLNAWYLMATIIASCLDLGLQRRRVIGRQTASKQPHIIMEEEDARSSIFWSAYSLERTLSTTLGRPLTLRDEAIDVEFPGENGTRYSSYPATFIPSPLHNLDFFNVESYTSVQMPSCSPTGSPPSKRARLEGTPKPDYAASRFSFRFDRITAEIKLMLYRVVQLPSRFPWPTDLSHWQSEAHEACNSLLATARHILSSRCTSPRGYRRALPAIELKYHQCILLLFRPSPAFRSPTADALAICHMSALEVLRIHSEQLRLGELSDTWLTAHMVFISGITIIYTAWVLPGINNRAAIPGAGNFTTLDKPITEALEAGINDCSSVLAHLGQTWSVARDAKEKFDKMALLTLDGMRNGSIPFAAGTSTNPRRADANRPGQADGVADTDSGLLATGEVDTSWLGSGDAFIFRDILDPPDFLDQFGDFSASYDFNWMADPTNSL